MQIAVQAVSVLLLLLGLAKLHGVLFARGEFAAYLDLGNALLAFVPNRIMLTIAGLLEIVVGAYGLRRGSLVARSGLLLWLGLSLVAYKLLLGFIEYDGPCGCLFGVTTVIPLSANTQRTAAQLLVLCIVSVAGVTFVYSLRCVRGGRVSTESR